MYALIDYPTTHGTNLFINIDDEEIFRWLYGSTFDSILARDTSIDN